MYVRIPCCVYVGAVGWLVCRLACVFALRGKTALDHETVTSVGVSST